jgi:tRNA nucleotidyltransferase (CCA-adding enzyme)
VRSAAEAFRSVDAGAIASRLAASGKVSGPAIAQAVHAARVQAVAAR